MDSRRAGVAGGSRSVDVTFGGEHTESASLDPTIASRDAPSVDTNGTIP